MAGEKGRADWKRGSALGTVRDLVIRTGAEQAFGHRIAVRSPAVL
jgi:hypothetical protein